MNSGQAVFRQRLHFLPRHDFNQCVQLYHDNYRAKSFSTFDQFLCLAYAQVAGRESLRDIETGLNSHRDKLYHIGFRGAVSRLTLAITTGKVHDVKMLDGMPVSKDAIYTMDKAWQAIPALTFPLPAI